MKTVRKASSGRGSDLDPDLHPWGQDALSDAAFLEDLKRLRWALEWAEKDAAAHVMSCGEGWARKVSAATGNYGYLDNIRRAAQLVKAFPPEKRSPVDSPRTHAKWMNDS